METTASDSVPDASPATEDVQENEQASPVAAAATPAAKTASSKIDLLLRPTGGAPIMKKKKWAVSRNQRVAWVADFLLKYLKCEAGQSLFLYVNQQFAPPLDTELGTLFDCFGSDGKLVLHYCMTQAYG